MADKAIRKVEVKLEATQADARLVREKLEIANDELLRRNAELAEGATSAKREAWEALKSKMGTQFELAKETAAAAVAMFSLVPEGKTPDMISWLDGAFAQMDQRIFQDRVVRDYRAGSLLEQLRLRIVKEFDH